VDLEANTSAVSMQSALVPLAAAPPDRCVTRRRNMAFAVCDPATVDRLRSAIGAIDALASMT
jgi:hypothetical protein